MYTVRGKREIIGISKKAREKKKCKIMKWKIQIYISRYPSTPPAEGGGKKPR
jgi:hypothetical protein